MTCHDFQINLKTFLPLSVGSLISKEVLCASFLPPSLLLRT